MQSSKTTSKLAAITAIIFFALLAVVHLHGISQQYFEMIHSPEKYTEEIVAHSAKLNIIFVLDNLFILLYISTALFTIHTWKANAPSFVANTAALLAVTAGILDYAENFHIYTLMEQAKDGIPVDAISIRWQAAESMMKWHLAYGAFFLIGFLVPETDWFSKLFRYCLWGWFSVTGILVYAVANTGYADWFQWIRFINLFAGFVIISILMKREKQYTEKKEIVNKSSGE